jgi:voltage-dependent calcium channel
MAQEVLVAQEKQKRLQREYLLKYPRYNTSLFIFGPDNPIRKLCQKMVYPSRGHIRFQGAVPATALWMPFSAVVYSAIIAMVVLACVTTPLYQKEYFEKHEFKLTNWFVLTDAGFAGLFTLEVLVKVIADGLVSTPNAYLRSAWGVIDSVVLITLWISVISSLRNQSDVSRSVGAFKALRALRLLNISGSARDIFQSVILKGGRKIISVSSVPASCSLLICSHTGRIGILGFDHSLRHIRS